MIDMNMRFFLFSAAVAAALMTTKNTAAQTRSIHDTATAYGAPLNARGLPTNQNSNRINNRFDNRLNNRLALRIERYRPDSSDNPIAAFTTTQNDQSRKAPVIAPEAPVDGP